MTGTPGAGHACPPPIGTRVVRNPVEPCSCCDTSAGRRPPLLGTVMCHAEGVCSCGLFSVRWDNRIWEANLDVSDVSDVPREEEDAVTPLSRSPRTRAAG